MEHRINSTLLRGRVRVHLVGVGGNGAQMAHCLARLDLALRALGHPAGLHLTAYDADRVSEANVGRQVYSPSDIGQHKAVLTIHRLNQFYGLDWEALPTRYAGPHAGHPAPDIVVSCVDSARSRRDVHQGLFGHWTGTRYWLDLGNTEATGQIVLGDEVAQRRAPAQATRTADGERGHGVPSWPPFVAAAGSVDTAAEGSRASSSARSASTLCVRAVWATVKPRRSASRVVPGPIEATRTPAGSAPTWRRSSRATLSEVSNTTSIVPACSCAATSSGRSTPRDLTCTCTRAVNGLRAPR
mgnify:CR=1 FL=1